jgi:hypothetical protein
MIKKQAVISCCFDIDNLIFQLSVLESQLTYKKRRTNFVIAILLVLALGQVLLLFRRRYELIESLLVHVLVLFQLIQTLRQFLAQLKTFHLTNPENFKLQILVTRSRKRNPSTLR